MSKITQILAVIIAGAMMLASGGSNSAHATVIAFPDIELTGLEEVPSIDTPSSGTVHAVYDTETKLLIYSVRYDLVSTHTFTAAHFHGPAPVGENAGIQVPIANSSGPASDLLTGTAVLTQQQEDDLLAGLWYVNVHSNVYPPGEIRGQMIATDTTHSFADLPIEGSQEVPPVSPSGSGVINASYDTATRVLTYGFTFEDLTSNATVAHFHGPAPPGENAPPVITIPDLPQQTSGVVANFAVLTESQEIELLDELWYINIHSENHAPGEIRGQMLHDQSETAVEDWLFF